MDSSFSWEELHYGLLGDFSCFLQTPLTQIFDGSQQVLPQQVWGFGQQKPERFFLSSRSFSFRFLSSWSSSSLPELQQCCPEGHDPPGAPGHELAPGRPNPKGIRAAPASPPKMSFNARERGIGVARMRQI